jgi:hypothetical protein
LVTVVNDDISTTTANGAIGAHGAQSQTRNIEHDNSDDHDDDGAAC